MPGELEAVLSITPTPNAAVADQQVLQDTARHGREEILQGGQADGGTGDVLQEVEHLVPHQQVDLQAGPAAGIRFVPRLPEVLPPGSQGPRRDLEMRCGTRAGDAFGRELFGEVQSFCAAPPVRPDAVRAASVGGVLVATTEAGSEVYHVQDRRRPTPHHRSLPTRIGGPHKVAGRTPQTGPEERAQGLRRLLVRRVLARDGREAGVEVRHGVREYHRSGPPPRVWTHLTPGASDESDVPSDSPSSTRAEVCTEVCGGSRPSGRTDFAGAASGILVSCSRRPTSPAPGRPHSRPISAASAFPVAVRFPPPLAGNLRQHCELRRPFRPLPALPVPSPACETEKTYHPPSSGLSRQNRGGTYSTCFTSTFGNLFRENDRIACRQ